MERAEAEAVSVQEPETIVAVLLEFSTQNALLRRQVAELSEANRRLESRVAELEQRLNRNSRNSSLPPSVPPRPRQAASGRRVGAQPGHPGRGRRLASIESLDELVDHWPARCRCGHVFCAAERAALGEPARHQVAELPPTAVILSEHRLQRLRCPDCGATTRAELPAEVPPGAFGPRLQAAVATLAVRNRVSRRDTTELLRELFGAALSTGSINMIVSRAGAALEEPYAHLHDQLRQAPALNIDETGWRTAGGRRTLWGVLSGQEALFRIAADRHRREAQALLGEEFAGTLTATACLSASARSRRSSGRCSRRRRARAARNRRQRSFAKNLLKGWPALWTFAGVPGVEPTNNPAERGLRGAVIYRKLSLGSQSEEGERTIERLLSASVTCRLQGRSLFAYLSDVLAARIRGDPIPLLA